MIFDEQYMGDLSRSTPESGTLTKSNLRHHSLPARFIFTGYSSLALLQQIYNQDGLILKPSRAITMIDEQIANRAFHENLRQGQ